MQRPLPPQAAVDAPPPTGPQTAVEEQELLSLSPAVPGQHAQHKLRMRIT